MKKLSEVYECQFFAVVAGPYTWFTIMSSNENLQQAAVIISGAVVWMQK